jgi:trans-aconitate 2-methyltransferase
MTWDPESYLRFSDERLRPGLDLLSQVPETEPRTVIDLGCGTGTLTRLIATRWPQSHVVGLDSSEPMLKEAKSTETDIEWVLGDIADWNPPVEYGLVFSNAALHWVADHENLFTRLSLAVTSGGTLAIQMPDNWAEPTHSIPARVLDDPRFAEDHRRLLLRDRVASPTAYRSWIGPGFDVDIWQTTYHHVLEGVDPVLTWVTGSILAPVLNGLDPERRHLFLENCRSEYARAYPTQPDGTTVLAFRRLFIVARRR